ADPEGSVLYQRSATAARGLGMPPLGRSVPDPTYVAVLERWIRSLTPTPSPAGSTAAAPTTPPAALVP
ncbi:MAG TPA: hypothetical protein VNN80_32680, partial [Polyangiaceae bacterium]|nr:hypothetical protein [Polyangiaceae bacterium]